MDKNQVNGEFSFQKVKENFKEESKRCTEVFIKKISWMIKILLSRGIKAKCEVVLKQL